MRLLYTKQSVDGSTKWVFETDDGLPLEVGNVVNGSDKDIQVVPTFTGCGLGCKFCALSTVSQTVRPLRSSEIIYALDRSYTRLHETRLISVMGAGEPLLNLQAVVDVFNEFPKSRHAVASIIPSVESFDQFVSGTSHQHVKLHWSLHCTNEIPRSVLMPQAAPIQDVLPRVLEYSKHAPVEIHYALMAGINDTIRDVQALADWFAATPVHVKLLRLSPCRLNPSPRGDWFLEKLANAGVSVESYCPPGLDIGASCGMFDIKLYRRPK